MALTFDIWHIWHLIFALLSLQVFEGSAPSGHIYFDALERALKVYGSERLSAEQIQDLLDQIEPDDAGLFNYNDYVNMMMAE